MVTAKPLEWILSQPNIVTYSFLLIFVFGLIFLLFRGRK